MDGAYSYGVVCGLIIVVVLVKMLMKRAKLTTDGAYRVKYDERQKAEIGRGYRCAFCAYMIYNGIFIFLDAALDLQFMQTGLIMLCGVLVAAATHVIYCIFHEAYWGLNNNAKNYIVVLLVAMVLNLICGIVMIVTKGCMENGVVSFRITNLLVAVFVAVILAALLVKWVRDKREVE